LALAFAPFLLSPEEMMNRNYVPPEYQAEAFHCPHCHVYAHQSWWHVLRGTKADRCVVKELQISYCVKCREVAIWKQSGVIDGIMIYPLTSVAPHPADDMPDNVKEDFQEARRVFSLSPRSAAALLRLALQKLLKHLGEKGKNIDDDIGSLVQKGLPVLIQQSLDAVRVIGNNAVHPGHLDLKDKPETAMTLFGLLNFIVEQRITQPKHIDQIYNGLPKSNLDAIAKRDAAPP
jgi:uncharacterized protein DUF4145